MFCSNCGTKLNDNAKFCYECGSAVAIAQTHASSSNPQTHTVNNSERRQEYVGKVLKCPHCGYVITETTAICPACGMQITGRAAVSSIQAFKDQLMEIERTRKQKPFTMFNLDCSVDPADMRKLTLIRNFPIPNSIDDVVEFMLLAVANIEVSLSKQTLLNKIDRIGKTEETSHTIPTTISDAWVAKMEQVYRKAEIVFPNEPAFAGVKKIYLEKMAELKIKVK